MSNYVVGVVAHTDRQRQTDHLVDILFPDDVSVDDGTLGVTGNHLKLLRSLWSSALLGGSGWVVVLEEDAQPVAGFHQQLNAALDVAPTSIVSLYNGTGYPAQKQRQFSEAAARSDVCWIISGGLRHAVAYALRRECFEAGLLDFMEEAEVKGWAPDDAISKFARARGLSVANANPSICEHEDGPPVIKTRRHLGIVTTAVRKRPRKAHWVGTRLHWTDKSIVI